MFSIDIDSDYQGLLDCLQRKGTPKRVYHMELFADPEVQVAVAKRFGIWDGLDRSDPFVKQKQAIAFQSFMGYDYVRWSLDDFAMPIARHAVADSADSAREGGRQFVEQEKGPITTWDEFEAFPWPDPAAASTRSLEWFENNLPEGMCVIGGGGFAHFAEYLTWLMGYQTLCIALCIDRELVAAIAQRLLDMYVVMLERILEFDCVKMVWAADDMGFRNGTLVSPNDLREFVLPGHRAMAAMCHAKGRPYLLHCCGKIDAIMNDLIDDVKIDAKHSFEDNIESVADAKAAYGNRIAVIGGIDVDFLCRATEHEIRDRVRRTLEQCHPTGGYALGTGNSVANYIPLENYLAMVDEGRKFTG